MKDSQDRNYWSILPAVLHAAAVKISGVAIVSDGYLTIAFNPVVGEPKINAIEVQPIDAGLIDFPH
jgi:hypothetical protein